MNMGKVGHRHSHSSSHSSSVHHEHRYNQSALTYTRATNEREEKFHNVKELPKLGVVAEKKVIRTNNQSTSTPKIVESQDKVLVGKIRTASSLSSSATNTSVTKSSKNVTKKTKKYFGHQSYSDYSSGFSDSDRENEIKTDYTYAKSASYCSSGSTDSYESPNMSRRCLHSTFHRSSLVSEEHDSNEHVVMNKSDGYRIQNTNPNSRTLESWLPFQISSENEQNFILSHHYNNLEYITGPKNLNDMYGFDGFSDVDEELDSKVYTTQKDKTAKYTYNFSASMYYFTLAGRISRKASWLWYFLWSCLYKVISHVLVFDTWFLSRLSGINRKCLLVIPLLFLLLFLLYGCKKREEGPVLSSSVNILSSTLSFISSMWSTKWLKTGDQEARIPLQTKETQSESWLMVGESLTQGNWFQALFGESKVSKEESSRNSKRQKKSSVHSETTSTQLYKEQVINLVRDVFKQEIAVLKLEVITEQETIRRKEAEDLAHHTAKLFDLHNQIQTILLNSKYLREELSDVKEKLEAKGKSEIGDEHVHQLPLVSLSQIDNKFEALEKQVMGIKDLLYGMRNCCHNQSEYLKTVENQLASILLQVMNENRDGHSPFATFGQWLKHTFVTQDQFASQMSGLTDHMTSELSIKMKQHIEEIAQTAASAIALSSAQSLREELQNERASSTSAVFSISANDSKMCASQEDVKKIVRDAIYLYDADKTGLVDYALESQGGIIVSTRCSETYQMGIGQYRIFGIPIWHSYNSPRIVIQPGIHPGECWAFKGSYGYLVIKLSSFIRPTAFSLEHIPKSLSPKGSIDSAPKDFSVWGLQKETDLEGQLLGDYTYNEEGDPLQYFVVKDQDPGYFSLVELRIHSNQGNMEYTCLYRFRVHGVRQ
ncbi:SUN domain-containing protein 2-like isoform X3 [Limulus polyphemus]|uniref:SUN domain-containing protein 2-like isoform X3 n=1 Tax=Limulus polyphemus TaxID=6850 RepID=A0ABM1T4K5_LIMPO|nr:SUN domain-containing protein 2-like isoform X3 [Limulus polyphemus]